MGEPRFRFPAMFRRIGFKTMCVGCKHCRAKPWIRGAICRLIIDVGLWIMDTKPSSLERNWSKKTL
jgi:hypothetical protein